jgi:hypothetical protein
MYFYIRNVSGIAFSTTAILRLGKSMDVEATHLDTKFYEQNELTGPLSS